MIVEPREEIPPSTDDRPRECRKGMEGAEGLETSADEICNGGASRDGGGGSSVDVMRCIIHFYAGANTRPLPVRQLAASPKVFSEGFPSLLP